ncbi:MAG: hypothetical protein A2X64_00600 [Ignavibacteria bacterium GWF2_33_9]|nr:MAG: hypothetical protein A2X64_00600 [Ignavibacteria bacterium GWF2_33_9]
MKISFQIILLLTFANNFSFAETWNVGPNRTYKFCSEIMNLVEDGDVIKIDSALYENDKQVTWTKNNLSIRGANGKPILKAGTLIANDHSNGKGIFVILGNNTLVENIEFSNSKVPDHNGAGIKLEGANLLVRNCTFSNNEMGILQGGTIANCRVNIEFCKFMNNGSVDNPGYQHNVYINHIDTLYFRCNETLDAIAQGHELKSRASNNFIYYNRISNLSSEDSRNIDLPNGGTAVIVGNIIEQGPNSANSNIIGFGMEGLENPGPHNLYICNNTIVNRKNKGSFIQIADIDTLYYKNNFFLGAKTGGFLIVAPATLDSSNNIVNDDITIANFKDLPNSDFHLLANSPGRDAGTVIDGFVKGNILKPFNEFDGGNTPLLRYKDDKIDIGAYEFNPNVSVNEGIHFGDITIFPNPASDYIAVRNMHVSSLQEIQIYDVMGMKVISVETQNSVSLQKIDVSALPTGVYFLRKGDQRMKFMIVK